MKHMTTLTIGVNNIDDRAQAFDILTRTARDVDAMFPYISVTALESDADDEREDGDEFFDEYTLFKVVHAMREAGLNDQQAEDTINALQNAGILFRERA